MLGFLVILGSILLGVVCSICINRILITKKENKSGIPSDAKSELNNLLFEKSIALEALNKINQYFDEKKIDVYEKDRLLLKYDKLLEHYDKHILKLHPIVETQEIYEYRGQLYSFLQDYLIKLDKKVSSFSNNFNFFQHNNEKVHQSKNKTDLNNIPIIQNIDNNTKPEIINNSVDHLSHFENAIEKDSNSPTSIAAAAAAAATIADNERSEMRSSVAKDTGNDYDRKTVSSTKKDNVGDFTMDEINNIHKDVLKILQRLENTSV